MPTDDLQVMNFDNQTEVVPPPFRSDCKATPPGTPPEEEPDDVMEDDIPGEADVIPDLDTATEENNPGSVEELDDNEAENVDDSSGLTSARDATRKTGLTGLPIKRGNAGFPRGPEASGKGGYPISTGKTGLPKDPADPSSLAHSAGIPNPNDVQNMADVSEIPGSDLLVRTFGFYLPIPLP